MRLGLAVSDFPAEALNNAADALRTMRTGEPERILNREACLRVPFLVVAFDKVDRLNESEPEVGVRVAKTLIELAKSIPIRRSGLYYRDESEKRDFRTLAEALLVSSLAYAGRAAEAFGLGQAVLERARARDRFVLAEAKRRYSQVLVEYNELDKAIEFCTEAYAVFEEERRPDMAALCALRRGSIRNLSSGRGSGTTDYGLAAWLSTLARRDRKAIRERADRVACAACLNMIRDFHDSTMVDDVEVLRFVRAVRSSIGRPSRTKTAALMMEGLVAARGGAHRQAGRILTRSFREFVGLKAFSDAAICLSEVFAITEKWEPESLQDLAATCQQILDDAPVDRVRWLARWLKSEPTARRIEELRAEALARQSSCPARTKGRPS